MGDGQRKEENKYAKYLVGVKHTKNFCVLSCFSHVHLCDPMDCSLLGSSVHGIPGKNTGVGCHALLQGIFPTQGSNPYLLYLLVCWPVLYPLSHLGSPLRLVFLSIALISIFTIPSLHYLSCIHPLMPNLSTSLSIRHLFSSSEMATFDHLPALCKSFQS